MYLICISKQHINDDILTHRGRVTHICVSKLSHRWFWYCLARFSTQSHYMKQSWFVGNCTNGNFLFKIESKYNNFHTRKRNWKYHLQSYIFTCTSNCVGREMKEPHESAFWWLFPKIRWIMMTSSNGNIFRVTGPLCGEFTCHKASDAELWCFLWSASWINGWVNNRGAGDLRQQRAHYDVIVMYESNFICLFCV